MMMSASLVRGEVYTHWHHIIPKYEGGSDDPSNLVELTIEDHAIAHRVRWMMFKDERDKWAWYVLAGLIDGEEFRREGCRVTQERLLKEGRHNFQKKNASECDHVRRLRSERMKGNTINVGRPCKSTTKNKIANKVRGNTNVRGTVWVINNSGHRRRVNPNQIPEGYRRGAK